MGKNIPGWGELNTVWDWVVYLSFNWIVIPFLMLAYVPLVIIIKGLGITIKGLKKVTDLVDNAVKITRR